MSPPDLRQQKATHTGEAALVVTPDWAPFLVCAAGEPAASARRLLGPYGVADRLRTAAFAELQAREAFLWAATHYQGLSSRQRNGWRALARAEDRHLRWLLARMEALGVVPAERQVSDRLWCSLTGCPTARDFAATMAEAEERGRAAGERFCARLAAVDEETAALFGAIAEEEIEHIVMAQRLFGIA